MLIRSRPLILGVSAVLLSAAVAWLWVSWIRFRPDNVQDFSTITGTLLSADEHISGGRGRSGYMDIRLQGDAVRYCVPADGYLDYFRRDAFFAEVPMGSTIQLAALKSDIESPRKPLLNPEPTVFVRGVQVNGQDYCRIEDHIAWQKRNNWGKLALAVAGTGLIAYLLVLIRRRRATESAEPPEGLQGKNRSK